MDETIDIRRGRPEDASAIRDLTREAYARWVPLIGREPIPMVADYDEAVKHHRFDLLYVGGVLAALIETVDEGDQLLIENVAVLPRFQGRGLGSKLMGHAESIACSLGRTRLRLYTNKAMAENIGLYLRLGYQVDGEAEGPPGFFRVHMSKALSKLVRLARRGSVGGARRSRQVLRRNSRGREHRISQLWRDGGLGGALGSAKATWKQVDTRPGPSSLRHWNTLKARTSSPTMPG